MGFGTKTAKPKPSYTGLQLNSASSVLPLALIGGMTRVAPNLWDYDDFEAIAHKQKTGGKGFGGSTSTTTYTYSATVIMGLCEGVIAGVVRAWKDQGVEANYSTMGFSLFTGTIPQAPWGYMSANHAAKARGYPGGAYLAKANMDLGASASIGNFSFEVQGLFYNTGVGGTVPDADPALWVQFYLTDDDKGAGFPSAQLDAEALLSGPDAATTGDSAYQTYCQAMGFAISPGLVEQEAASAHMERVANVTNAAMVWTGSALKWVPYGDQVVAANGVTFIPPTGVCYDFGDGDYRQENDADPVSATRSDPADAKNTVNLVIRDRANAYNEAPVPFQDHNAVALFGPLPAADVPGREVCDIAMAARMVALIGQRVLYDRNRFEFTVDPRFDRLEPMDVVTLTDTRMGLDALPVRIEEISEDADDNLVIVAVQFPGTVGHPSDGAASAGSTPTDINSLAAPGPVNPPILFEPNSQLATFLGLSQASVVALVSGGDGTTFGPYWGGCTVYVSTDDATYTAIGQIDGASRMGKLTANLATYGGVNPDAGHTASVSLLESNGELESASSGADAEGGSTLAIIGDNAAYEIIGPQTATLTGANAYDLTDLYRGLFGTLPAAHVTGDAYGRLDKSLFSYSLPAAYVGRLLYFKFQSFNIWGQAQEDLAGCTAYTLTPAGTGYGGGAGGVPTAPSGVSAAAAGAGVKVVWAANPATDNVTNYLVSRAPGTGASFGSASLVATVAGETWTDAGVTSGAGYTYFVQARNAVGSSAASAGEDVTASADGAGPVVLGFQRATTAVVLSDVFASWRISPAYTLPAGLTGSELSLIGAGAVAPLADVVWDIQVAGVSIGSATIAAGAFVGTFAAASDAPVASAELAEWIAPASLHGMSGLLTGSMAGNR
jgi:hypothetical protein